MVLFSFSVAPAARIKKQRIDDVKTMLEKMLTDYYIIDEEAAMKHYNTLVSKGYYNESDENRKLYFKQGQNG